MAKGDATINIRVTCGVDDHCFEKFDATRIFCRRCGQFRSAPGTTYIPSYPWTHPWTAPQPTIWWSTSTDTKTTTTYNTQE